MATFLATKELRTMQSDDLRKEISEKRMLIGKMQIDIEMRSEKDTAQFLRHKKELARMLTVLNEKKSTEKTPKSPLKAKTKKATVPARRSKSEGGSSIPEAK